MLRRFNILNAIVFAIAIFALSVPLSEARLGKRGGNKHATHKQSLEDQLINSSEECTVPCRRGSASSITVCHQRGGVLIEICTEAEAFAQHKEMGDTCGFCGTERN
jgi:hypothetical protein